MRKFMTQPVGSGRNRLISGATAFVLAVAVSGGAWAHKTFLASPQAIWPVGQPVTIAMTSALEYPDIEFPLARDRVASATALIGATEISEFNLAETDTSLEIQFAPVATGYGVLAVVTHPRSGEISSESVDVYFDEIDADQAVQAAFHALPGTPALMRSYTKLTKTFFCVDACLGNAEAWHQPLGLPLEFIASDDGAGRFALYQDGQPLAGHRVTIHTPDGRHFDARTDVSGQFTLDPDIAGEVLLSAVWIDLPDRPDGNYHSDQATLTVRID